MKYLDNYKLLANQEHTVNKAIEIIDRCNGVFIMDETGLGKTITSLTTVLNIGCKNLLVVTPNKHKKAWQNLLKETDFKYTVSGSSTIAKGEYDFIIVDEADKYRNVDTNSYKDLFMLTRNNNAKVILLTATPFQNTFIEFMNTIALINFNKDTFANILLSKIVLDIDSETKKMQVFERKKDITNSLRSQDIIKSNINIVKQNLPEFCLRTTRSDIEKYFPSDLEIIGLFPKIVKHNISYDNRNESFNDLIQLLLDTFNTTPFARYNIHKYTVIENDKTMANIIKSLLLKRMDSSLKAFIKTVEKMILDLENILLFETNNDYSDVVINEVKYLMPIKFFNDCKIDIEALNELLISAKKCDYVGKEEKLLELVNEEGKCIVFTEYKSTLNHLCELFTLNNIKYIKIDGSSTEAELELVISEFDANAENITNEYKVLICTDVMSAGVNLHYANNLVHYDSKWNPQKTIQRNGRVDRISKTKSEKIINIYTFAVDKFIDSIIDFENKVTKKMNFSEQILNFDREYRTKKSLFLPNKCYVINESYHEIEGYIINGNQFLFNIHLQNINFLDIDTVPISEFESNKINWYKFRYHTMNRSIIQMIHKWFNVSFADMMLVYNSINNIYFGHILSDIHKMYTKEKDIDAIIDKYKDIINLFVTSFEVPKFKLISKFNYDNNKEYLHD